MRRHRPASLRRAATPGARTAGSRPPRAAPVRLRRRRGSRRRSASAAADARDGASAAAPRRRRSARPARPATWISSCASFSPARKSAREQAFVDADHRDQGQVRQVVALGQHLRADQDAGRVAEFAPAAIPAHRGAGCCRDRRAAPARREDARPAVPRAARCRRPAAAAPGRRNPGTPAAPAWRAPQWWHCRRRPPACTVIGGVAALALRAPAAVVAQQHRRVAAAVLEHQHLAAGVERAARSRPAVPATGRPASGRLRTSSTRTAAAAPSPARCVQAQVRVAAGCARCAAIPATASRCRAAPARPAPCRAPARSRARGSGCRPAACSCRRVPRRPRSGRRRGSGVNTAERVPTTTRASPRQAAVQTRARSPSFRPECSACTGTPRRARKRASVCGVSPISGTSTSACRPRARQSAIACR